MAAAMAAFLVLATYFTFAAVRGDHGIFARGEVEAEIARLTAERDAAAQTLARLDRQVTGLSDHAIDLDLLDERARRVLGWMRTDEIALP